MYVFTHTLMKESRNISDVTQDLQERIESTLDAYHNGMSLGIHPLQQSVLNLEAFTY